jgi:mannonate dehydratase
VECEDEVRKAMARGFEVVRAQVSVPGRDFDLRDSGRCRGTAAKWGGMDRMPPVEGNWEPLKYLRIVPRLMEHLRSTVGDTVEIIHDAHQRLTPQEAARLGKELEPYHLFFLRTRCARSGRTACASSGSTPRRRSRSAN